MIFLTGDVHNSMSYGHPCCENFDEPAAALKYAAMAAEEGMKATLFATGRAVLDSEAVFRELAGMPNVELGGHGWDSFCKPKVRTLLWSLSGSRHGPRWHQRLDIHRTVAAFRRVLDRQPVSWRQHAFYTDEHSYALLREVGVRVVSDRVVSMQSAECTWASQSIEKMESGLWSLPINTTPDHDSLEHGGLDQAKMDTAVQAWREGRERGKSRSKGRRAARMMRRLLSNVQSIDVFPWSGEIMYAESGMKFLSPSAWERSIMEQIESQLTQSGFATLLLHPVCMELLDGMAALRRIMARCRRLESALVSDVLAGAGLKQSQAGRSSKLGSTSFEAYT
jgi:peptidoglycan/xylan/chitin deacetylase (PgdA/CDA1 family)